MSRFVVRVARRLAAPVALAVSVVGLGACSPALNWREVRLEPTVLVALLPCKPDQGTRTVSLAGQNIAMHMLGCEADSATFAVSYVEVPIATQASAVQAQWQAAMLGNMRAAQNRESPFSIKGVVGATGAVQLQAQGAQPDGRTVMAQGVWFARGTQVFHAVMYANQINPDAADAFFSGFRLP